MCMTVGVVGLSMVMSGTLLVGFICPWTRGAQGCNDDRNYPALRGLLRMPKGREDLEPFAWYGGWTLIFVGSLLQLGGMIQY